MNTVVYKGYLIQPAPSKNRDKEEWTVSLYIRKDTENETIERKFTADDIYKTEYEAINHCINFGKKIIDGKSENCSISDL